MVSRAVNTDKDIIKVGDLYYMCFQAVWFVSTTPNGPWEVATSIPKEIYTIPASSASHHVTYVTIEEDDDDTDEWVTFAYVAGYTGMMVAWGCVVWGSGWYYPPYIGWGGTIPGYYPYPRTYGMGAWYNPWTGAYGRAAGVYGPYGGVTAAARYNPRTGTYSRGAAAYGPYGGRAAAQAYNPRTNTLRVHASGFERLRELGIELRAARRRLGAHGAHAEQSDGQHERRQFRRAVAGRDLAYRRCGRTTVGRTGGGDVYAGHDGNVYRRVRTAAGSSGTTAAGSPVRAIGRRRTGASQADRNRPGTLVRPPARAIGPGPSSTSQLERDRAARSTGTSRTTRSSTYQKSPSVSRGSTYGGGMRAGGAGGRR